MRAFLVLFHAAFIITTLHYSYGPDWVYDYYNHIWTAGIVMINLEVIWYVLRHGK